MEGRTDEAQTIYGRTEEQIVGVWKKHELGAKAGDLARKHGISEATLYNWKAKYGGLTVSEAKRLKSLEDENSKLKKLLADAMLATDMRPLRTNLATSISSPMRTLIFWLEPSEMSDTNFPEAILRGIEIVRRGDPWSIVQLRSASPQAGRIELLALLERAANSIRAIGVLNDAGHRDLGLLVEAIEAASKLDDSTAYPWTLISGDGPGAHGAAGTEGVSAGHEASFPEIVRRAIEVVRRTDPNTAASILRHPYNAQRGTLAVLFAKYSAMIQSVSSWGGIGADGYAAIEALDTAVALLKREIGD